MTFTFKISRPPLEVAFDAGSVGEGLSILQENSPQLAEAFGIQFGVSGEVATTGTDTPAVAGEKRRGRRSNAEIAAAAAAATPPPMPVPGAPVAPTAPLNTAPNPGGIPAFLDRAAGAPPPPPALPAAPPVVPAAAPPVAAPPVGVHAVKIVAELSRRAAGAADKGASLVGWLAGPGIGLVVNGATFDEACAVLKMTGDEKLAVLLAPLGIA